MANDWADEMAAGVTCCAGPMCCERKIAQALRQAEARGMERAAQVVDKMCDDMRRTEAGIRFSHQFRNASSAIRDAAKESHHE